MTDFYLVYNPVAGRGRQAGALARVSRILDEHGLSYRSLTTTRSGEAREFTAQLPETARILAIGGDGTLQEVASACVSTPRSMGIVPAGSGDDLAFALGMDRDDLEGAVRRAIAGTCRRIDTGLVNGRTFVNAAGTGFDAEVALAVRRAPAYLRERSAYLHAVLSSLQHLASVPARVTVDGLVVYHDDALLISVQNGPRSGGSFPLAPAACPDDGVLDVVVAGNFSRLATLGILPKVMRGTHLGHPKVSLLRGKRVTIDWETSRPMHLDGELLEPTSHFELEIKPASLSVLL